MRRQEQLGYRRRFTAKIPSHLPPEIQVSAPQGEAEGAGHRPNGTRAPLCGHRWLKGLVCSHTARLSRKHPQDASASPHCRGCPCPALSCSRHSDPGTPCSRKSQGNRRPGTQSIAAALARGSSSAPLSAARPIAPAGSHSRSIIIPLLLLSHACLPELSRCRLGCRMTTPVSPGLRSAVSAVPTQCRRAGRWLQPQRVQHHFLLPARAKEFPELAPPTSIRRLTHETDGVGRAQ